MKVADFMQAPVRAIDPDAAVAEAVLSLADAHVSALPVVDQGGRVLGVVSTTDIIAAESEAVDEAAHDVLLRQTLVKDIMTPRPLFIAPESDLRDAARQMLYADVHRLFVARDEQLLGVISSTDIVRAVAHGAVAP